MQKSDIPVNIVFWLAFLEKPQGLCQVVVQRYCFMTELPYQEVLFLDLFFKRPDTLKLCLGILESLVGL